MNKKKVFLNDQAQTEAKICHSSEILKITNKKIEQYRSLCESCKQKYSKNSQKQTIVLENDSGSPCEIEAISSSLPNPICDIKDDSKSSNDFLRFEDPEDARPIYDGEFFLKDVVKVKPQLSYLEKISNQNEVKFYLQSKINNIDLKSSRSKNIIESSFSQNQENFPNIQVSKNKFIRKTRKTKIELCQHRSKEAPRQEAINENKANIINPIESSSLDIIGDPVLKFPQTSNTFDFNKKSESKEQLIYFKPDREAALMLINKFKLALKQSIQSMEDDFEKESKIEQFKQMLDDFSLEQQKFENAFEFASENAKKCFSRLSSLKLWNSYSLMYLLIIVSKHSGSRSDTKKALNSIARPDEYSCLLIELVNKCLD